jgi:hypothetical protein
LSGERVRYLPIQTGRLLDDLVRGQPRRRIPRVILRMSIVDIVWISR